MINNVKISVGRMTRDAELPLHLLIKQLLLSLAVNRNFKSQMESAEAGFLVSIK